MDTEFKEKPFEKYFSIELARLTKFTFSPDPCDESFLGFDDAFWMPLPWMAMHMPYVRHRRRARRQGFSISELEHIADEFAERMPPYRFNLFVQYKRPVRLISQVAPEWGEWGTAYYRYITTPHQQALLVKIEEQSHGRAATVYASPAFWRASELFEFAKNETVVANSNIASVGRLSGHHCYTYINAGFQGKGHSEAMDISSPSLEEVVTQGLQGDAVPFKRHLKQTANLIAESVDSSEDAAPLFQQARAALVDENVGNDSLTGALATISAFCDAFSVSYYAMG